MQPRTANAETSAETRRQEIYRNIWLNYSDHRCDDYTRQSSPRLEPNDELGSGMMMTVDSRFGRNSQSGASQNCCCLLSLTSVLEGRRPGGGQ